VRLDLVRLVAVIGVRSLRSAGGLVARTPIRLRLTE
jgi:hypothetical protein